VSKEGLKINKNEKTQLLSNIFKKCSTINCRVCLSKNYPGTIYRYLSVPVPVSKHLLVHVMTSKKAYFCTKTQKFCIAVIKSSKICVEWGQHWLPVPTGSCTGFKKKLIFIPKLNVFVLQFDSLLKSVLNGVNTGHRYVPVHVSVSKKSLFLYQNLMFLYCSLKAF
jgi:hypothetical protein